MPRGIKAKQVEEIAEEEVMVEDEKKINPRDSIQALIVKLCDDVTEGRTRDEFKTLEAIANLYNAVK